MHTPWVQVENDLIRHAPDLAAAAGVSEEKAGWAVVRLISWALSRCPEDAPPSANSIVEGPGAAEMITLAAGLPKKLSGRFVEACAAFLPRPILEVLGPDRIRVKGLGRYDSTWAKNRPAAAKEWRRTHPDWGKEPAQDRAGTGPEPRRASDDTEEEPKHQTQTQTQKQTQRDSKAEAPPPENRPPSGPEQPEHPPAPSEGLAFFAWAQAERETTLKAPPQELTTKRDREAWDNAYLAAKAAAAATELDLQDIWLQFLCDEWAQQRAPACPWQAFASRPVLERCISRVLDLRPPSPPAPPCAKCRERASETEVWGFRVCYRCYGSWQSTVAGETDTEVRERLVAWIQAGRAA